MENRRVRFEIREGLGLLTLRSPTLSRGTIEDLDQAWEQLAAEDGLKGVVLTGYGNKIFASGADIKELEALDPARGIELLTRVKAVFNKIRTCPRPTIAALNGHALGGGLELALHCDFRLAVESAKMGLPEITLGVMPGAGGTQLLPRLIGPARARKMLFSGETVSAREALEMGLVDRIVPAEALLPEAFKWGQAWSAKPPLAYQAIKKALTLGEELPLSQGLEEETLLFGGLCGTQDKVEGVRAFLERRKPIFQGR